MSGRCNQPVVRTLTRCGGGRDGAPYRGGIAIRLGTPRDLEKPCQATYDMERLIGLDEEVVGMYFLLLMVLTVMITVWVSQ